MDIDDFLDQVVRDAASKHYCAFLYPFPPEFGFGCQPEPPGSVGPFRELAVEAIEDCLLGNFDAVACLEDGADWRLVQDPHLLF